MRVVRSLLLIVVAIAAGCAGAVSPTPSEPMSPIPSMTPPPNSTAAIQSQAAPSVGPSPTPDAGVIAASAIAFFDRHDGLLVGSSGGEGVIWRTADGGLSYQKALLGPGSITTVSVLGQADAWVATACPDGSPATCQPSLFHSSDGGRTWEAIAEVALESISFVSPADGWAVGALYPPGLGAEDGKLLRTTDAGRHWRAVAENVCPGGWWSPRAVSFADARHGWVGCRGVVGAGMGPRAIAATADGGTTWHLVAATSPPGGLELGRISISGYLTGIAMRPSGVGLYWADRGVTEKTLDGGRTWTVSQPSGFDTIIVGSAWLADDSDWYALVWDGGADATTPQILEESVDAGRTWRIVSRLPLPTP